MRDHPIYVYFDSNFLIGIGKGNNHPFHLQIRNWVNAGLIKVIVVDHTKNEIVKKFTSNDVSVVKEITRNHTRALISDLTGIELPELSIEDITNHYRAKHAKSVTQLFRSLDAKEVTINSVKPSEVFDQYANSIGFFQESGKKDQFPDAFIFSALLNSLEKTDQLVIVTRDNDFTKPADDLEQVIVVQNLVDLANQLGLVEVNIDLDEFFDEYAEHIRNEFRDELQGWGWVATDVVDAEIDPDVELLSIEFENLHALGMLQKDEELLVIGRAIAELHVQFDHPDWDTASYDSEDKILIPHHHVTGETEIEATVNFAMTALMEDGELTSPT